MLVLIVILCLFLAFLLLSFYEFKEALDDEKRKQQERERIERAEAEKRRQEVMAQKRKERTAMVRKQAAIAKKQAEALAKWQKEMEEEERQMERELLMARRSFTQGVFVVVREYQDTLLQKYNQTVYVDDWGEAVYDDFFKEISSFILNIIPKKYNFSKSAEWHDEEGFFDFYVHIDPVKTGSVECDEVGDKCFHKIVFRIDESDEELSRKQTIFSIIVEYLEFIMSKGTTRSLRDLANVSSPIDYEKQIATNLKKLGFEARTTKASGDQGADVLASKDGVSFAIQCKMYSKPVGNKAVQEANAGRDFYKKDYGVVISNAGFTKSARQAAHACGIILLNDNQLESLLKYTNR